MLGVDETIFTSKGSIIVCKPKLWDNLAHTYWAMITKYGWHDHEKTNKASLHYDRATFKNSVLCSWQKVGHVEGIGFRMHWPWNIVICCLIVLSHIYLSSAYVCSQVIMRGRQQNISMLRSYKRELNKCVES